MDIIHRWSWKFFVAEWAILVDWVNKDREEKEQREAEREQQRLKDAIDEAQWRAMAGS